MRYEKSNKAAMALMLAMGLSAGLPQVAGAEGGVHHLHGREVILLRGPVGGKQRQGVLQLGNVLLEGR